MTLDTILAQAFSAPLLRDLAVAERAQLAAAARVRELLDGEQLYQRGQPGDAFFAVVSGRLSVRAVRRGDDGKSELRVIEAGQSVGEEALFPGLSRRATVRALGSACVVEFPVAVLQRAAARAGSADEVERTRRAVARAAARDVVATHALTRYLPGADRDLIVDAARFQAVERGARLCTAGDLAEVSFLIVDGLVQLQAEDPDRVVGTRAVAYLTDGDFLGERELGPGERYSLTAVAMGPTHVLRVPATAVRAVYDRNPGLAERASRMAESRAEEQATVIGRAAATTTRHVFRDLYRMQVARSLLVIDQDTCVRCGHCAWSCAEVYGHSRLVRRGDKVVAAVARTGDAERAGARALLLPNSCQHCHNAACMIDCPTGAIGRDPQGEVFIREHLCTGCGHCAKNCPWENIRMAPRPAGSASPGGAPDRRTDLSEILAVKCDLCRAYQAPACVQACPTGSLLRLQPSQDIAEVKDILGVPAGAPGGDAASVARLGWRAALAWSLALALALVPWALAMHGVGAWRPRSTLGWIAGLGAGTLVLALAAYAVPKRWFRSLWMRPRVRVSAARRLAEADERAGADDVETARPVSRLRPYLHAHVILGFVAMAAVAIHAGARMPVSPAGALHAAFWLVALVGAFGALAYRVLPARLSRIERRGALPEDLVHEREALTARLFRRATGQDARVKNALERVLIPYARSLLGPAALFVSGRTLAGEEARLARLAHEIGVGEDRVDARESAGDMRELVRIAVEIRALPARRAATWLLRAWLPMHILMTAVLLACLLAHILTVGA